MIKNYQKKTHKLQYLAKADIKNKFWKLYIYRQ